jgi:hypothetical protein
MTAVILFSFPFWISYSLVEGFVAPVCLDLSSAAIEAMDAIFVG